MENFPHINPVRFQNEMKIEYTNYDGDWDEPCPYCKSPQRDHQKYIGEHEGTTFIHRQPCEEEQYEIRKRSVQRGIATRIVLNIYETVVYIFNKIPFKDEFKIVKSYIETIYKSIRAVFYLRSKKPKRNLTNKDR